MEIRFAINIILCDLHSSAYFFLLCIECSSTALAKASCLSLSTSKSVCCNPPPLFVNSTQASYLAFLQHMLLTGMKLHAVCNTCFWQVWNCMHATLATDRYEIACSLQHMLLTSVKLHAVCNTCYWHVWNCMQFATLVTDGYEIACNLKHLLLTRMKLHAVCNTCYWQVWNSMQFATLSTDKYEIACSLQHMLLTGMKLPAAAHVTDKYEIACSAQHMLLTGMKLHTVLIPIKVFQNYMNGIDENLS